MIAFLYIKRLGFWLIFRLFSSKKAVDFLLKTQSLRVYSIYMRSPSARADKEGKGVPPFAILKYDGLFISHK